MIRVVSVRVRVISVVRVVSVRVRVISVVRVVSVTSLLVTMQRDRPWAAAAPP